MHSSNGAAKALIIAPFWHNPTHVGGYRVDRFVRWLAAEGVEVVMVCAGRADRIAQADYGTEVTVRDPLGLYGDKPGPDGDYQKPQRRPSRLRRSIAYWLFNPDPGVVWAKRAARHPRVLEHGEGARWVIASNPPESVHVAGAMLARRLQADLIVDMRDGWLDTPLRPILQRSRLRRWLEGRLETRILRQAKHIFVVSPTCRLLLTERLAFTRPKTTILTNGYPLNLSPSPPSAPSGRPTLIHAGRFTGSSNKQAPGHLLAPLLEGVRSIGGEGNIVLIGSLEPEDLEAIARWRPGFADAGWRLETRQPIPRAALFDLLQGAAGLLLLSVARNALPSKLFEYLPTGKPILCATLRGSDAWQVGVSVPQMFPIDYTQPGAGAAREFLRACMSGQYEYAIPPQFSEAHLAQVFLHGLR